MTAQTSSPSPDEPPAATTSPGRGAGPLVVGVLSGVAHLVPGFLMLVSGLLAPLWAVVGMLAAWALLAWLLVALVRRRSWWSPAVPVVALVLWSAVVTTGENLLGWTA